MNEWLYMVIALVFITIASEVSWFLTKYNVNLAILNITVDFFLGISLFVRADVPWPTAVTNLMSSDYRKGLWRVRG